MKKVWIKWIDSKGITTDWEFKDNLQQLKPAICYTMGFLLEDNAKYKTVAQTISKDQILGRMTIPNCAILKIKEIYQNEKH